MTNPDELAEQWFAQALESYPRQTTSFLATEKDPFRNPVGHALRNNMKTIVEQVLGAMNGEEVKRALDGIIRLRVVQDFTPGQAVAFVFLLRAILLGSNPPRPAMVEAHIEQLALLAFDQYVQCRELVSEVRASEQRRRTVSKSMLRHK